MHELASGYVAKGQAFGYARGCLCVGARNIAEEGEEAESADKNEIVSWFSSSCSLLHNAS